MSDRPRIREEDLSAYLDDELSPEEARTVAEHLRRCEASRKRLEGLRRTRELVRRLPSEEMPEGFRDELFGALAATRRQTADPAGKGVAAPGDRGGRFRTVMTLVAASILLFVLPLAALVTTQPLGGDDHPGSLLQDRVASETAPQSQERDGDVRMMGAPKEETEDSSDDEDDDTEAAKAPAEFASVGSKSEMYTVRVGDVEGASAAFRDLIADSGGTLESQDRVFDSEGELIRTELIGSTSSESLDRVATAVEHMGVVTKRRSRESFGQPLESAQIVVVVEHAPPRFMVAENERPTEEHGLGGLWRELQTSFSSSWQRFGASVAAALVWISGHLPHLVFVGGLLLLIVGLVGKKRRPRRSN